AGHPSWDVRFLRNHLKRTPNIQLISFFILINADGVRFRVRPGDTALIPFPAEDLFVNELGSFDLIVLQDFNYGPFSTPQHLFRIRDYVKGGGAILMVGGRKALGAGEYAGTEVAEVLPVDMTARAFDTDALDTTEFTARLTEAGKTHTITRLDFDPAANERLWEGLPPLEGVNLSRGLMEGATPLLEHSRLKMDNGEPMPVLAVSEPGEGRAAVFATDSSWRYRMPNSDGGGDPRVYDNLWNNVIRWLIKDPELDLVRVHPSNGVRPLGESVDIEIRVFEPDYRPAKRHDLRVEIRRREDAADRASGEVVHNPSDLATDDHGRHQLTWEAKRPGIYDVSVRTTVAGRQLTGRTVFVVSDERPEMRRVIDSEGLLASIAQATKGKAWSLDERNPDLILNPPRVSDVTSRRYHERWNVPGVFILACLLFAAEWWFRRRVGLL
ncbi:MAG: putative membrane protein, partial [Myxococcota bacterium]